MSAGSVARATAGVIAGALIAVLVVVFVAQAIATGIGHDEGGVVGMVIVMWGAPIALVVGAVLGGKAAAAGLSSPLFRTAAGAATVLIVLAIGLNIALPDSRPKSPVDAQGCTISPRMGSLGSSTSKGYVMVYHRYCQGEAGHTVNVKLTTIGDTNLGPGNVLVLAGDAKLDAQSLGNEIEVIASMSGSRIELQYDYRARVLSQATPPGYEVVVRLDTSIVRR